LIGTFFTAAGVGFAVDLLQLNHPRLGHGSFWPIFGGTMAAGLSAARIKKFRLALPLWLVMVVLAGLAYRAVSATTTFPLPSGLHQRVVFDAVGVWLGTGLGFRLLLSFVTTEGLDNVRMQTELSLARGIQATLVPTISFQSATFEVYGKSIPSTEMGGDLMDLIENDRSLLAYVGDISGHGLAAGQLMGMLKTAMRVSLQFQQHPVALLEGVDRVLPALKEPDMYATLALLRFDGSAQAEYALAGHVPILHYRDRSRDTTRLSMRQFPLGLIPGGTYASQRVTYSSRDLFLLLTDGISEVPNDRDEEFGLTRLEQLLTQYAAQPLMHIWDLIMGEVRQHGLQQDDQTLLLVRVRH
jgi:sigma-B regulation protein RsbU (phosphoserine phosphatase)